MGAVLEIIFSSFSSSVSDFVREKFTINENLRFTDYASGIRLLECSKFTVSWKNGNSVIIAWHDVIVRSFRRCFVSVVNFSCWSKFNANIITGSVVMTISFFKGLTINPEIVKTPIWALPNIWRLGWVKNTKFDTNVSNKILLNAAKFQCDTFYRFWVIKEQGV